MTSIIDNKELYRFEVEVEGDYAYLEYRYADSTIYLMHTFVPEISRNKGIAAALSKFALESVKSRKLKAVVYCPYVKRFVERHPEYKVLLITNRF